MSNIVVSGNIFGTSGYAVHTRNLALCLLHSGNSVRLETPLMPGWERIVTDEELSMIQASKKDDEVTICVATPPFWSFSLNNNTKYFIGFLVWEGDKIPSYWLEHILDKRISQIWVPSKHTYDAVLKTSNGLLNIDKLRIVPHGFNPEVFVPVDDKKERPFTFVVNKGWVHPTEDRGGTQYALKAYSEEFTKNDNVRLVLKVNPSYSLATMEWFDNMLSINGIKRGDAEIVLTGDVIGDIYMKNFYGEGDVYLCPTRCDGFNLAGLEAHACGLPTIQTGFGGQVDYMSEDSDYFIPYELVSVKHDISYEGIKWATPDIIALRKLMRHCYNNPEEVKNKGARALELSKKWTWSNTANKANEYILELEKDKKEQPL